MIVQYFYNQYPWWDDDSLSKPSQELFKNNYMDSSMWTTVDNAVVTDFSYTSAIIEMVDTQFNSGSNLYFRLSIDGTNYFYFFEQSITFENLSNTSNTATVMLRLDYWGTCMSCLNINNNLLTHWTTQVLATNKEVNLYDFWSKAYNNMSSFTWLKNVYPQLQNIQLIKYTNSQYLYQETGSEKEQMGNSYWYKIGYTVSTYNDIPTDKKSQVKLEGGIHDYYTQTLNYPTSNNTIQITGATSSSYENLPAPFVYFSPVVSYENSQQTGNGNYCLEYWSLPLILNISTDKDIGLIALPFCLTNKNLPTQPEQNLSGNQLLNPNTQFKNNGDSGGFWTVDAYGYDAGGNSGLLNGWNFKALLIDFNGLVVNDGFWQPDYQYLTTVAINGANYSGTSTCQAIDGFYVYQIGSWGFNSTVSLLNKAPTNNASYTLFPCFMMYPMLFNYYSYNINYMGQTVSYTSKYVNNVLSLFPYLENNWNYNSTLQTVFSANYPNLTLNVYAKDNILSSANTPIGQFNLSTALLPNTTNPEATFETNEHKIINNSATLKNLDIAKLWTNYLGGLGLNSLLNPLSLFTSVANVGLDTASINLNYSNSFGTAKQFELAHQNTLQTAGDNLGAPDNQIYTYQMVPSLNDIQNIIGMVDKYGYPYNQWDRFNNLFANYYHNYIKLGQNADLVVYVNAPLLIKEYQTYLIKQFTTGVVIWANPLPNERGYNFMDTWQLYNDCMNNKDNYWDTANWDANYGANFKFNQSASTLKRVDVDKQKQMEAVTEKKEGKLGWKKL